MSRLITKTLLLFALLLPLSLQALTQDQIRPVMRKKVDRIITLINDANLSRAERNKAIETEIDPLFDFTMMAKLSLGKKAWKKATPQERREYVRLFERRIKDSYMSKLDMYNDEKITLETPEKVKKRIHLNSYIIQKGEKKEVLYKFYHSKKRGWVIYDVDVLGVSIIQTYRSQFAGVLKKGSMQQLLEKLRTPDGA